MSFKGFLKKAGAVILKGAETLPTVGPMIKAYTPDKIDRIIDIVTDKTEEMSQVVITVEAVGQALQLTGADKLKAAIPLMSQVVLRSGALAGKGIDDPVLFNEGVTDLVNGWVKIQNSVKADSLEADI